MLKQVITSLLFLLVFGATLSAQSTVEQSMSGLQFNLRSAGFYHEVGLNDQVTFRFQADLRLNIFFSGPGENIDADLSLQPALRAEPRFYYNLAQREAAGKRTANNSGNFLSLKTEYLLPFRLININDEDDARGRLSIIPRWGIRRNLGSGWDFELGLGAGIRARKVQQGRNRQIQVNRALDIEWKFGFRF